MRLVAAAPIALALAVSAPATLASFSAVTTNDARVSNLTVVAVTLAAPPSPAAIVRLDWTASPTVTDGPLAYVVMRRPAGSGAYTGVVTTTDIAHDDAPGDGTWEYLVRTTVGAFSADSNVVGATVDGTPPSPPGTLTAATGTANGTVALAWTAAADAGSGVAGYAIRYVQAAVCPGATEAAYPGALSVGAITSTTVGGLARNKTYCFYAVALDVVTNASAPSNVASAKAK